MLLIKKSDNIFSTLTYPFKFHNFFFHLFISKELAYLHPNYVEHMKTSFKNGIFMRYDEMHTIYHPRKNHINYSVVFD